MYDLPRLQGNAACLRPGDFIDDVDDVDCPPVNPVNNVNHVPSQRRVPQPQHSHQLHSQQAQPGDGEGLVVL